MTGAETTLLAAAVGGGSAVLAATMATIGTYKVTNRSITAQRDREREERLVEAYVDLLWLTYCVMMKVERERPRWGVLYPDDVPEISIVEETRIKSRTQAIGSSVVRNRLELWRAMVNGFRMPLGMLDEMAGGRGLPRPESVPVAEWAGLMADMNERREALRDVTSELEAAVRAELTDDVVPPIPTPQTGVG